jgi:hypothetical protein
MASEDYGDAAKASSNDQGIAKIGRWLSPDMYDLRL